MAPGKLRNIFKYSIQMKFLEKRTSMRRSNVAERYRCVDRSHLGDHFGSFYRILYIMDTMKERLVLLLWLFTSTSRVNWTSFENFLSFLRGNKIITCILPVVLPVCTCILTVVIDMHIFYLISHKIWFLTLILTPNPARYL